MVTLSLTSSASSRTTICRGMARRCCPHTGVPLPISSPADERARLGTCGAAITAAVRRSSTTPWTRTGAARDAIGSDQRWIAAREAELSACPDLHATVTVPAELRARRCAPTSATATPRSTKATAEAIIELARDRRHVGGTVGVMAVLHTWTQQLVYHPHVHCLVTGGGVSDDGRDWYPARDNFLVPTRPLAVLVRAKMRAALAKRRPDLVLPKAGPGGSPGDPLHSLGDGAEAVLRYGTLRLSSGNHRRSHRRTRRRRCRPSATSIAHRGAGTQRASAATNSCAASCNTCCRKGCTRSATQGSGITPGAIMLRAPVSSWRSIARKPQDQSRGLSIPPLRVEIVPQHLAVWSRGCPCCKVGHHYELYPKQVRGP